MQNILIGIKRFFQNKNTLTIIAIVACVFILYFFYNYRIKSETDPVSLPYAVKEIGPRTLITQDMVATRKVPGGLTKIKGAKILTSSKFIVGKYVKTNSVIPKGSMFYGDTLTDDWTEARTTLYDNIDDGFTLVSLPVTIETTYGNSIFPGNYIDLYYVGVMDGKLLLGKLVQSIKVLGVIDSDGRNVFEKVSSDTTVPSYLVFAVPEEYYLFLQKASYLAGTIFPIPRNSKYSTNPKDTSYGSTVIQQYILAQTVDVANKDKIENNGGGITIFDADQLKGNAIDLPKGGE